MKSGQLPADLNINDIDAVNKNVNAKEDKMVTDDEDEANDEPKDAEPEQKNDGPSEMEQVPYIFK